MTIRTFRAPSVADALSQIKKELGATAVILHTRTYKVGGLLGVGGRTITEITATSDMKVASRLESRAPRSTPQAAESARAPASPARSEPPAAARLPNPAALAETLRSAGVPSGHASRAAAAYASAGPTPPGPVPPASTPASISEHGIASHLRDEMASLKKLVGRLVHSTGHAVPTMPDALQACYLKLLEAEVSNEVACGVVSQVRDSLSPADLADHDKVRRAVLTRIAGFIPAADTTPPLERGRDGRPTTIALIGPTGVGKTTTIAKLAAAYKLRQARRVGLVTSDTYRIAAVEQLRTYAGIIGLPLRVALTPQDMASACDALRDCDVILIDTAGRAPGDAGRVGELARFLDAAVPHQVHLVLSSAASQASMKQAADSFASVGPTHVIFTKLDEAVNFGVLVNIGRQINAKLSFVTTGQEVPDQIEPGNAERLARLVLDGAAPAGSAGSIGGAR